MVLTMSDPSLQEALPSYPELSAGVRGGAPQIFHWLNHDINTYIFSNWTLLLFPEHIPTFPHTPGVRSLSSLCSITAMGFYTERLEEALSRVTK